jgi:acyl transferase domain-containing protein
MILSAASPEALRQRVKDVKGYMEGCSSMQDLAYNLAFRREMLPYRTVLIGRNDNVVEGLDIQQFQASSKDPKLHFVFTGQGAQWAGMGKDLLETYEDFLADIKAMDETLQKLPDSPQWTIQGESDETLAFQHKYVLIQPEELSRAGNVSRINEAELSQPLCTAVQIGIVNLLSSMGAEATTVVGHSSGEIGMNN